MNVVIDATVCVTCIPDAGESLPGQRLGGGSSDGSQFALMVERHRLNFNECVGL